MRTELFYDPAYGTRIVFDGRDTVTVTVEHAPFSKRTMDLDLDDVDRLLAVVDHAEDPALDLAEFFRDVFHVPPVAAARAGVAFNVSAPGLAETLR